MKRHVFNRWFASMAVALHATAVFAQGLEPDEIGPALPDTTGASPPAPMLLPPLEAEQSESKPLLSVYVARIAVEGSTVFGASDFESVLAPFAGRTLATEELLEARDAITDLYVRHGYATSGATLPDQDVENGTLRLRVIEGSITRIEVRGNERFRDRYFERRLSPATAAPVQLQRIERLLQRLQRDEWIDRIDARLEPGSELGESRLVVVIDEATTWQAGFETSNSRSPTVGSASMSLGAKISNVVGVRDIWSLRFEITQGLRDVDARFEIPISPWDTRLRMNIRDTRNDVVQEPFELLDISADARTYGISLFHPLYRSGADEVWFEFTAERRRTHSKILGESFCFELEGDDCEKPTVTALRVGAQWTHKTQRNVIAMRNLVTFGVDRLGASSERGASLPDGEFIAWLGQAQWAHVLPEALFESRVVMRADVQLANDPLLSMEKFAVGGHRTVRGYRENQIVRDNGVVVSGEARVPLWRDSLRRHRLQLVPFVDYGRAWNEGPETPPKELLGVGAGLRLTPREGFEANLFWGGRVKDAPTPSDTLQDDGVYMSLEIDAPFIF